MSFISFKYFEMLLVIFAILNIFKQANKKYMFILFINYWICSLYGIPSLAVLFISTVYSFVISKQIINNKKLLLAGIVPIVALLIGYKVLNLYTSMVSLIGISFYGLQIITYLIDITKDSSKYESDFFLYASAISFFPALSSGPIEKVDKLITRLKNDLSYNSSKAQRGIQLIAEGLFKKLVIANRIVEYVDVVYANPSSHNGLSILIAIFLYSIQIYCDFSAYSDLAIGSANILGIELIQNFNTPYFSKSIKEFWRRWHISLSTWLKEYIYIPLGGNKKGKIRKYLNTIITFIVSGLWHGLSWTYLVWGLIHGLLNSFSTKQKNTVLSNIINTLETFILVSLSWIFFRSSSLTVATNMFVGLFTRFSLSTASITEALLLFTRDINSIPYSISTFIMILVLVIKEFIFVYKKESYNENIYLLIIVVCVILFGTNGSGAFIYQGF